MKKIITILVLVLLGGASFAQYNKNQPYGNNYPGNNNPNTGVYRDKDHDGDRDDWNRKHNNGSWNNGNTNRQRDIEIARINQEYSYKVQSIQRNWFMSSRQKAIRIREAEMQRDREIQIVYGKYNGYNNNQAGRYDNNRYDNNRYDNNRYSH